MPLGETTSLLTFKPVGFVSLATVYAAVQMSETQGYHLDVMRATGAPWSDTLAAAVKQHAPRAEGGFMPLQELLTLLCVPATEGRAQRMLDIVRSKGFDWQTAFENTREDKQAESGTGKRTRAYERVKKARQRLVNALEPLHRVDVSNKHMALAPERIQYCNGVLSALLTVASRDQAELYKTIVLNSGLDELVWVATHTEFGSDLDRHYLARHGFMPAEFLCTSQDEGAMLDAIGKNLAERKTKSGTEPPRYMLRCHNAS